MAESYSFLSRQATCYRDKQCIGKKQEENSDISSPGYYYKYMHVMLVSISYHRTTSILLSFTSCIGKEHGQAKT